MGYFQPLLQWGGELSSSSAAMGAEVGLTKAALGVELGSTSAAVEQEIRLTSAGVGGEVGSTSAAVGGGELGLNSRASASMHSAGIDAGSIRNSATETASYLPG